MSYIRFLHDGDETIVATRGRPFRGVWQRTIDRVRAEIPDSAEQWIPPEITFAVRKWDTARAGWEVVLPWPFGTLAGGTTSDPRVVAFLMQHSYRDESWRRRIEVNGELYQVYVTKVPQWLDPASMTGMVVLALASE